MDAVYARLHLWIGQSRPGQSPRDNHITSEQSPPGQSPPRTITPVHTVTYSRYTRDIKEWPPNKRLSSSIQLLFLLLLLGSHSFMSLVYLLYVTVCTGVIVRGGDCPGGDCPGVMLIVEGLNIRSVTVCELLNFPLFYTF